MSYNNLFNEALKCFDYTSGSEADVRRENVLKAAAVDQSLQIVVPRSAAKYFEVQKLVCRGSYTLVNRENCHRAGVVTAGDLILDDGRKHLNLTAGDGFFLPCALERAVFNGNGEVIFALPPAV